MAYSTIQNMYRQCNEAQRRTRALMQRALAETSSTYTSGRRGSGDGQQVLVLGGTGYIGKALVPELVQRGYRPLVLSRSGETDEAFGEARVVKGDPCEVRDLERVFNDHQIRAVVTLLSSRRPNDEEECRRVDYQANRNALRAAAKHSAEQFIHISDYGCYRPEMIPQIYKLQLEGELLGRHHGQLDFTIVRPTAHGLLPLPGYVFRRGAAGQILPPV